MNNIIKKIPFPIAGLILSLFALGNLTQTYGEHYRISYGLIAFALLIMLVSKIIIAPNEFKEAMKNPVVAGAFATFPMAIMVGSVYVVNYLKLQQLGQLIWFVGLLIQIIIILYFIKTFVVNFKIQTVFPTWFVAFVGIAVATLTAGAYKQIVIGQGAFWFAFVAYLVLLPTVIYRVVKIKNIPDPAKPTLVIFAAPASLLLAAYMTPVFPTKNILIIYFLLALSVIMYVYGLITLVKLATTPFNPGFSAFTFPVVISGVALKLFMAFVKKTGGDISMISTIVKVEEFIATVVVLFVLTKYIKFLINK